MEKNREKAWEQDYVTTGNGGLGYYIMWTQFRNDGNVPTHNVDRANSKSLPRRLLIVPGFTSTKLLTNDVKA